MVQANASCLVLFMQEMACARALERVIAGRSKAARMPIIPTTTNSSIKVNPSRRIPPFERCSNPTVVEWFDKTGCERVVTGQKVLLSGVKITTSQEACKAIFAVKKPGFRPKFRRKFEKTSGLRYYLVGHPRFSALNEWSSIGHPVFAGWLTLV